MKVCFIINPRAGRARDAGEKERQIRLFARNYAKEAAVFLTEYPRHAIVLAGAAVEDGCDMVVACGGDGTVNEVAQKLVGTDVTFGILPCGSGNGLARHLGIPGKITESLDLLLAGETRLIDTGIAAGIPFVNVMGLGYDAVISDRFNRVDRRGMLSYCMIAAQTFATWVPSLYRASTDGETEEFRALLIAIANSSQYGNNAFIAPEAEVDDGRFNLVAICKHPIWQVPSLAAGLFSRSLNRHPCVTNRTGSRFIIERSGPGLIHTDGESHMAGASVKVEILEKSLRIRVPMKPIRRS